MMTEVSPPQPRTLAEAQAIIAALWAENAQLRARLAQVEQQVQAVAAQAGQTSANSSRPPSTDPPQALPRPPGRSTGRRRGAQPGHPAYQRPVPPPERVDRVVDHWPPACQHCRASLAPAPDRESVTRCVIK